MRRLAIWCIAYTTCEYRLSHRADCRRRIRAWRIVQKSGVYESVHSLLHGVDPVITVAESLWSRRFVSRRYIFQTCDEPFYGGGSSTSYEAPMFPQGIFRNLTGTNIRIRLILHASRTCTYQVRNMPSNVEHELYTHRSTAPGKDAGVALKVCSSKV